MACPTATVRAMGGRSETAGVPDALGGRARRWLPSRPGSRILLIVALLLAVFAALRLSEEPGFAFSMYALVPILLAVAWFELVGGLLAATAATLLFVVNGLLLPSGLAGLGLAVATLNRASVFYGVAVLVTLLLRRERALTVRLSEQQRQLAELQSLRAALTPSAVPPRPSLDIATAFVPADEDVAGDFFLVTPGPLDSTTVVVGDVVGHGLGAARRAAFVRAALATYARFSSDPVQLLMLADTALLEHEDGGSRFVTAVCLNVTGGRERRYRWAAAGHSVPWDLDTGAPLPGGRVGSPLGVGAAPFTVEAGEGALRPGSGVLLFTDGLVEGRSARRPRTQPLELFGEERVRAIVREQRGAPVGRVLEELVSALIGFANGPLADDLCLVALRAEPSPAEGAATLVATSSEEVAAAGHTGGG